MNNLPYLKLLGIVVVSLGLAVGCAAQQQVEEPAEAPTAEPGGPSEVEQAISDAEAAIAKAKALDWIWRDTEKMLKKAKELAKEGKDEEAIKLANEAKAQAELAVEQYYREQDMDRSLQPVGGEGMTIYTVMRGDNLWNISGKSEIYGDPFQWPLIYKANSDKIRDADLIYPGQEFDIDLAPSAGEVDAAIQHAKTRGAWSLGVVEESDRAYLAR